MQDYNLATHSYGLLDLKNNIELLTSFLQHQNKVISSHLENGGSPSTASSIQQDAPMDTDIDGSTDVRRSEKKSEKDA